MTDLRKLPVLNLADTVVLPGMVVPLELDEAAQAAVDAARSVHPDDADGEGEVLLAPRLADRYATHGVIAVIERVGRSPGGNPAAVLRAGSRARIGTGVTGPGAALWVEAEEVPDAAATDRAKELAADYKTLVIAVLQQRDAWQVINTVERMTDPSMLADAAGWAPYLTDEQKRRLLETTDLEARLELVTEWTRAHLAEMEVAEKIRGDVRDGMEKSQREFLLRQQLNAIRKELGEDEPEGADDYRGRVEAADLPGQRPAGGAARGRQARAGQRPVPRVRLDPDLAGHRVGAAVGDSYRGFGRRRLHRRRPRGAGRRPPRPVRRQGPDR